MQSLEVVFTGPGQVATRQKELPPPSSQQLEITAQASGISWGSESRFLRGEVNLQNNSSDQQFKQTGQQSRFPARYGYCHVGKVTKIQAPEQQHLLGQRVFSFSHHQSRVWLEPHQAFVLPAELPSDRATLIPNCETALNLLLDCQPLLAKRVLVIGLGVVGQLVCQQLSNLPLQSLMAIDRAAPRCQLGRAILPKLICGDWNQMKPMLEQQPPHLVIELSGHPGVWQEILQYCAPEAHVVVGSWYGDTSCQVPFDSRFHRKRLTITSSQVSAIPASYRGLLNQQQRLQLATDLLTKSPQLDQLITHQRPIEQAGQLYQTLMAAASSCGHCVITY